MNESSFSTRITRGISLHVNFVDNLPSFLMGLTQDFGVDVASMTKSKQVQDKQSKEELRSKKKKDPMTVQKVVNNVIARGIKIVEERTKKKKLTSDSEESESKIDGSEEHQDHEIVA